MTYQELAKALHVLPPHLIHLVTEALERLIEEDAAANRPFLPRSPSARCAVALPAPGFFTAPDVSAGLRAVRMQGRFMTPS
jgi:hypothetical protein